MRLSFLRHGIMSLVAALTLAAAQASSVSWYKEEPPPPHPTIVLGTYKDHDLPIVAAHHGDPEVEVDGKLKTLRTDNHQFTPKRAKAFAPGSMTVSNVRASTSSLNLVIWTESGDLNGGEMHASSDFSATLTPSQDYTGCYMALVVFDKGYLDGSMDLPNASILFQELPDLTAGQPKQVNFSFDPINGKEKGCAYFPLFFSHGAEIRTNHEHIPAMFFAKLEESRHAKIVETYLKDNHGTEVSRPLRPYMQVPPLFEDPAVLADAPARTTAAFTVDEHGNVDGIELDENLPAAVATVLRRTLAVWRFLPQIKNGIPVRTPVRLPMALR